MRCFGHGLWFLACISMAPTSLAYTKGMVNVTVEEDLSQESNMHMTNKSLRTAKATAKVAETSKDVDREGTTSPTSAHSEFFSTAGLKGDTLWKRKVVFASIIAGSTFLLVLLGICVLKCQQAKKPSEVSVHHPNLLQGWKHEKCGESRNGGGTSYSYKYNWLQRKGSVESEEADGQGRSNDTLLVFGYYLLFFAGKDV